MSGDTKKDMLNSAVVRRRKLEYFLVFLVLFIAHFFVGKSQWVGSQDLHTILETAATFLSLMVGILALVRYYTKKNNAILFLGVGFLGTAFLDCYHTVVTSHFFDQLMPSPPASLAPWSWVASRVFLSFFMFLSWWAWKREDVLGEKGRINEKTIYFISAILSIGSFLFFALYPLPRAYYPELLFGRPEEFLPALFFLLALIGYLKKGRWKKSDREHWIIISLIVGFMGQTIFMSFSFGLFDPMFDAAHLLKKLSYVCALIGLLFSMFLVFKQAQERTKAMELITKISEIANEAVTTYELMPRMLKDICNYMSWPVGHVYAFKDGIMVPTDFWYIQQGGNFDTFKDVTMKTTFKSGIGLPGRVLTSGKPAWIIDVTKDSNYPRNKLAKDIQVKAGFGFPVIIEGRVEVVLEFYSSKAHEPNDIVLNAMENVGFQVGRIIERHAAIERLQESESALKDQKIALDEHSIVAITDVDGKITYANNKFCETSQYSRKELLGQDHRIVNSGHHSKEFFRNLWETIARGEIWKGEVRNKAKDGSVYWVDTTIVPFLDRNGKPYQYLAIRTNITDRKLAEEQLKFRSEELARSNEELEQFAYVASHDLQEPLRMVASYTQLLSKRYREKLDSNADEYIAFAVDGANRMQRLISDLLAYSRVGTKGNPFEPVNTDSIYRQVLNNLEVIIKEKGAKITADSLPEVLADPTQMLQLFQNLIGNAIKFCDKKVPHVHVFAEEKSDEWAFSIEDNGIGIEKEYLDRIFVIFQRLHSREKYEGTGIGLAVCKKIVERHGGRIWVTSKENEGTAFHFTVPKKGG